jgi:hypothetical protein
VRKGRFFFFFQVVFKVTYFKNKIFMQPIRRFCHGMKGLFSIHTHLHTSCHFYALKLTGFA